MGYIHIDDLYSQRAQAILQFRQCYALEKIHGTSAHVAYRQGALTFHSGGIAHEAFVALFDQPALLQAFAERFDVSDTVTVYGEAYGGKCQHMSQTYGKELRFVAFDIRVNEHWLAVPHAAGLCIGLGLEFVDYALVSTDLPALDAERDRPSVQAVRNGIIGPKLREGIVLRPPFEVTTNNGERIIAKHKRAEFSERGRPTVDLDPSKREILEAADAIAAEWVTPMRLEHVIDHLLAARAEKVINMSDTPLVIKAMVEDVLREAHGEIVESAAARKAMGRLAVQLFKQRLQRDLAGV